MNFTNVNVIDVTEYLPEYKVVAECSSCEHITYMIIPKALAAKPFGCPECGSKTMSMTRALGRRIRRERKFSGQ